MKKILGILVCVWLSVLSAAYNIGDIGPGGGVVFLNSAHPSNNTGLNFEVTTVNIGGGPWSNVGNALANQRAGLAGGFANSEAIISQAGHVLSAAKTCRDYRGGGLDDWYLPSPDELRMMLVNRGVIPSFYGEWWSSNDNGGGSAGFLHIAWGGIYYNSKGWPHISIRAVRAFNDDGSPANYLKAFNEDSTGIVSKQIKFSDFSEISSFVVSENIIGEGDLTVADFSAISMTQGVEGKPYISASTGKIVDALNNAGGTKWVTVNFKVDKLYPIFMNGLQISDDTGFVFPQYQAPTKYVGNIKYSSGTMSFRVFHFTEWSIPQLVSKNFTGSAAGLVVTANGSDIAIIASGTTQDTGDSGQDITTVVAKISGLAYETTLNDVQLVGDIYKPMDPADTDYSVHFGYINRGNAADDFKLTMSMVSENAGHFGYTITTDLKNIAAWQIVSFSIDVNNAGAKAFERATLNAAISIENEIAVSYNAYPGASSTTFGNDGVYGGVEGMSYAFTFETEGYSLKVLNRVATINSPLSDGQFIPGAKVKYEIVIKNESAAVAMDVRIKDVIPANTHLYYLDGVTENQNVVGALNDVWSILSVTDNATAGDVEYQFSIPANETVTASYTVTVD